MVLDYSGYMSPKYAMHGRYSVKSDVFSFGVLVLEIISGKKNTYFFYQSELAEDLELCKYEVDILILGYLEIILLWS